VFLLGLVTKYGVSNESTALCLYERIWRSAVVLTEISSSSPSVETVDAVMTICGVGEKVGDPIITRDVSVDYYVIIIRQSPKVIT